MVLPCRVAHSAVVALASLTPLSSRWLTNSPAGITTTAALLLLKSIYLLVINKKKKHKNAIFFVALFSS